MVVKMERESANQQQLFTDDSRPRHHLIEKRQEANDQQQAFTYRHDLHQSILITACLRTRVTGRVTCCQSLKQLSY